MTAIVFDTETTGFQEPQVIEAAWLRLNSPDSLYVEADFLQRYKPSKPIELGALSIHHIYDEELADCPDASTFTLPAGVEYLIGHNVDYDWNVIGRPDLKRICTKALSASLWPEAGSHSQSSMIYLHYRAEARDLLRNAHAALDDVHNCRRLLAKIIEALGERQGRPVADWEELWQHSEEARIPKFISFGKHKGMAIADLPGDYVAWLLRQPDVDPYLVKALQSR